MTDHDFEFDEISEPGFLALIVGFESERSTMYFRQRHGNLQAVYSPDQELEGSVPVGSREGWDLRAAGALKPGLGRG